MSPERREITRILLAAFSLLLISGAGAPAAADEVGPFRQGSLRMSLLVGGGTAFDRNYTVLGLGAGYYAADGIELGLDFEAWTGNTPRIYRYSPSLRYVFPTGTAIKPYAGAFYRRTIIEGFRDNDAVGARAGLYFLSGRNAYFGAGIAGNVYLDCDRTVYSSCTEAYPELMFAVIF
jgi:hypothetical protein